MLCHWQQPEIQLPMSGNGTLVDIQIEKVRAMLTPLPKWG